jgi:hypothetical protein
MEEPGHCHSLFCQGYVQVQKELKQLALSLARSGFHFSFNFNKVQHFVKVFFYTPNCVK